jgi:hypothetical protein
MRREHGVLHIVDLWRRLRQPFVLPIGTKHHACEWEAIDVDVLGCTLCGAIHVCDVCTCKDVIETNHSVVCAVSGVVLRNHMYSDLEFVDTAAVTGPVSQFEEDFAAEVDSTVHNMFLSTRSRQYQRSALCELLLRWSRADAPSDNMVENCAMLVRRAQQHWHVFAFVSTQRRQELALETADECRRILRFMVTCGMPVKAQEVQRLTVGLLYLMRHGISTGCDTVLRQRPDVCLLLPAENSLLRYYGIHPKFITETENRIKFCLRMKMDESG